MMRTWLSLGVALVLVTLMPLLIVAQVPTCVPDTNCIQLPTSPFTTPTAPATPTRFIPPNSTSVTGQAAVTATRTRTPSPLATSTGTPAGTPAFGQSGNGIYSTVAPERFPRAISNLPVPSVPNLPTFAPWGGTAVSTLSALGNQASGAINLIGTVEGFGTATINLTPQAWSLDGVSGDNPAGLVSSYDDEVIELFGLIKGVEWTMFGKLTPIVFLFLFTFLWRGQSLFFLLMLRLWVWISGIARVIFQRVIQVWEALTP
ncbi:MAG: hypothetical protein ACOYL5_16530 [Phototrophicaceae bacterium]